MYKFIFMFLSAFIVSGISYADDNFSSAYLDESDLNTISKLSNYDKERGKFSAVLPGQVIFPYGNGIPTVVCALFEITDIALEKGELVFSVQLGDSVRWSLESAVSGSGAERTEHIIVKALDNGLRTSLIIATSKRTYHISLKSSEHDFMPAVSFSYPKGKLNFNSNLSEPSNAYKYDYTLASNHQSDYSYENVAYSTESTPVVKTESVWHKRNYDYSIDGDDRLLPVNIFDDGKNTYIQLPNTLHTEELPTVFSVTSEGGLLDSEKTGLINFRVDDHTFVIDGVYEHLRLVSGTDDNEVCAEIIKEG